MEPTPQTRPPPICRLCNEICPQSIALYITYDLVEMLVFFYLKTLEASLIDMATAKRLVVRMPTHRMRMAQPLGETRKFTFCLRPDNQVPVVGHQTISEKPRWSFFQRFADDTLKRFVITILLKERQARHPSIENMVNKTTSRCSGNTRHSDIVAALTLSVNNESCPLFLSSRHRRRPGDRNRGCA
jgi:hypothetical protein